MEIRETKSKLDMIIMIGIAQSESIVHATRCFFDTIKYYDLNKGDGFFKKYQELEGKFFKDEGQFILYNKQKKNNDLTNISISNNELKEFNHLCKEYGVDILYMSRPDDLEELFEMSQRGVELTKLQESKVKAFTIIDEAGEKGLKKDASLICFNANDLDVMERIIDKLEERTLSIEKRKEKAKEVLTKLNKQEKKDLQKEQSKNKISKSLLIQHI